MSDVGTIDLGALVLDPGYPRVRIRGDADGHNAPGVRVRWRADIGSFEVENVGSEPFEIEEVVLFEGSHRLPAETRIHAEGFTMLSQTGGTLGRPVALSEFTDQDHYGLREADGWLWAYNMIILSPPGKMPMLLGFASAHRFQGTIRFTAGRYEIVLDTEGLVLPPAGRWRLEEFVALRERSMDVLHQRFAARIRRQHPMAPSAASGSIRGWSSWVAHGLDLTAEHVRAAIAALKSSGRSGDVVQLDDGYQVRMGDWFATKAGFGAELEELAADIRGAGFVPGLWLAPFVADEDSRLFAEHPDWFVKDDSGEPLSSDRLGFGGWGVNGPWYGLDGSHPAARQHLESVFRELCRMGFRHFKLDALYWGCLRGARFHDDTMTRIESFRLGMAAVRQGLASGTFLTAANHPVWPCLGLIDASRTSMDIFPTWESVRSTSLQNRLRSWQHGRLWSVDPDSVLLDRREGAHAFDGHLSAAELTYHLASVFASGGLTLSGDILEHLPHDTVATLDRLPDRRLVRYHDDELNVATVVHSGGTHVVVLNPSDARTTFALSAVKLAADVEPTLGRGIIRHGDPPTVELAPRAGVVLPCAGTDVTPKVVPV